MGRVGTEGNATTLVRGARGTIRSVQCQSSIADSTSHNITTTLARSPNNSALKTTASNMRSRPLPTQTAATSSAATSGPVRRPCPRVCHWPTLIASHGA